MFVKYSLKNSIWIYHKNHAMHCSLEVPKQHQPKPLSLHAEHSVFVVLMKKNIELFLELKLHQTLSQKPLKNVSNYPSEAQLRVPLLRRPSPEYICD